MWREGDRTVALRIPDTDVQLMLEDYDDGFTAGGIFLVDSVDDFYKENQGKCHFVKEPHDIPPGKGAAFEDVEGNVMQIIDLSKR